MITECYIKGRCDNGVGKCAVVIKEGGSIVHQVAWKVPDTWPYGGEIIEADQFNCEILAATYAMQWCTQHVKPLVNLYSNLNTCQKWYLRGEFPESRKLRCFSMPRRAIQTLLMSTKERKFSTVSLLTGFQRMMQIIATGL